VLPFSAMFCADATGCQEPAWVARAIAAVDGDAVAPSVTPILSSARAEPRSTVTLPVH
jgi:hypothetical protein